MIYARIPNKVLLRCLLVVTVCLSTLMLMVSFKAANTSNAKFGQLVITERKTAQSSWFKVPKILGGFTKRFSLSSSSTMPTTALPITSMTITAPSNFTVSINASDYPFVLEESDICQRRRPNVFALIYVHTAPTHFKHRAVIRRTWGDSKLYDQLRTVTVFFVGRSKDTSVEDAIAMESQRYGDIIQSDFIDSYRNLSVKAVVALRWIAENCREQPTYVVKVDDDMFVNVFNLVRHLHYLHRYDDEEQRCCISCLLWTSMGVMREKKSKWYVSKDEFADDLYPPYCSGSAFFMYTSVTLRLYNASSTAPFLWVDDVYATGILARMAGVRHTSINSIVTLSASKYDSQLIQGEAVFGHMTGETGVDLRDKYWKKVVQKEESAVVF